MESTQKKWAAGVGSAALLAAAWIGKTAHIWGGVVDDALRNSYTVTHLLADLAEIRQGTYVENQAVDLFCTATASLNTTGVSFVVGHPATDATGCSAPFHGT